LTTAQVKALASAGKIQPDDLVWKEGMVNWAAAREVDELFPGDKPKSLLGTKTELPSAGEIQGSLEQARTRAGRRRSPLARPLGRTTVIAGLFMVLISRGCDSLARHEQQFQTQAAALQSDIAPMTATGEPLLWAFWRQVAFLAGTLLLAAGLVTVSYCGDGPERWICLALLAVIVASIYLSHPW